MYNRKKKELFSIRAKLLYCKILNWKLLSNRNEKKEKTEEIPMNKLVFLGISKLQLSEILTCEFWCGYVKPKHWEKAKLQYMDRDRSIVHI